MIRILTTQRGAHTVRKFMEADGHRQRVRIDGSTYQRDIRSGIEGPGTYISTDLERLPAERLGELAKDWDRLAAAGGNRLLNHPVRAMRRYELLRTLYE